MRKSTFWCVFLGVILGIATVPKAKNLGSPDFKVYYVAAQNALHSPELLYQKSPDRYLYLPTASLLFAPFAFSDNWPFHQWFWHSVLALLVTLLSLRFGWTGFLAMVILLRYLTINFFYGQVNLPLLALLVFAALWLKARPNLSAVLWSLASIWKIFPAVFGLSHLLLAKKEKNWRYLNGWKIAGLCAAVLLLLPLVFWPVATVAQLYREFFLALESKGLPLHSHNQSFSALLLRVFTKTRFEYHGIHHTEWGLWELPTGIVKTLAYFVVLGFSGLAWKKAYSRGMHWDFLCATCFSILFLSHIVWKDYFIFLFPPLVALLLVKTPRAIGVAAAYAALVLLSSPDIIGAPRAAFLDACSIHFWGAVLVFWGWYSLSKEIYD